MSAITYTLTNTNAVNNIEIRYFTFTDDANIRHVADLTNVGGSSSYSGNDTLRTVNKTYNTGGYLSKRFYNDSHDRTIQYSTHTGNTIRFK